MADAQDCAAADPLKWRILGFQSIDGDGDGQRVNASGQMCVGNALPATHFAAAVPASDVDCDDNSALSWRMQPYLSRDADADGVSVAASGEVCAGATLPAGYGATVPSASSADCNDANTAVWRFVMTYADRDSDGVGAGAGAITCIGTNAPRDRSLLGYDPVDDPSDPTAVTSTNVELSSWQFTVP